ncbi:hypothetical protein Tco_0630222 [Tanacetum coccineum]
MFRGRLYLIRSLPMRLRKLTHKVFKVEFSVLSMKRASDVEDSVDNVDDVDDQDDVHYHSTNNVNDLVRSFDLSFDFVRSFDRRTRKRVDLFVILLPHVLPTNPDRIGSFVVYKTLIFLGMLVLLKLEEDAPDCTRVDDDGVEFSPKGESHTSEVPYNMPRPYADGKSVVPLKYTKEEWDQIHVPSA